MQVEQIPVDGVRIGQRARPINEAAVVALVKSIKEVGLRTPITVHVVDEVTEEDGSITMGVPFLIAGRHRLEAMRRLGEEMIPAVVATGSEIDYRLWEIAENLHRADLTEAEHRQHVDEWVRLVAEKERQKVSHGGTPSGGEQPREKAIRKAAKELGISKSSVSRAVAAESLPAAVKAAADEAGLGTVKRAKLASEPSAEAQLAAIRQEQDKAEAKKRNKEVDSVIASTVAQEFGTWLLENSDLSQIPMLITWLEGAKPKEVIAVLRRGTA